MADGRTHIPRRALVSFFDAYWPLRHLSAERRVLRNIIRELRRAA